MLQHEENIKQKIFFQGQIYDSYNLILEIIKKANEKITLIDNIKKFNKQYPTIKISITNKFHDRFIIIDKKELYHCGASIKDLGKKCFAINKIENEEMLNLLDKMN